MLNTEGIRPQAEKEVNKAIESSKKAKERVAKYDNEKQQANTETQKSKALESKTKVQAPKAEKSKWRGR